MNTESDSKSLIPKPAIVRKKSNQKKSSLKKSSRKSSQASSNAPEKILKRTKSGDKSIKSPSKVYRKNVKSKSTDKIIKSPKPADKVLKPLKATDRAIKSPKTSLRSPRNINKSFKSPKNPSTTIRSHKNSIKSPKITNKSMKSSNSSDKVFKSPKPSKDRVIKAPTSTDKLSTTSQSTSKIIRSPKPSNRAMKSPNTGNRRGPALNRRRSGRGPRARNKNGSKHRRSASKSGHSRENVAVETKRQEYIGRYKVVNNLGKGGFGTVYECFDPENGQTVAIKHIRLQGLPQEERESIRMEMELLSTLKHSNILEYIDCVHEEQYLNIVTEFGESGDLPKLLKNVGGTPSEPLLARYTSQILEGLKYLHAQGVIHRDIKGPNILSDKDGVLKLADFGVATKLEKNSQNDAVGTPYWMAPEIIEMRDQTTACDIWSVGCTVIELLTGKPPYFDLNAMAAMYRIVQDEHPPLPENISKNLHDFLMECFVKDPSQRITASKLLEHKWVVKATNQLRESVVLTKPPIRKVGFTADIESKDANLIVHLMTKLRNQTGDELTQAYCDFAGKIPSQLETVRVIFSQRGITQFIHALEHYNEQNIEAILTIIISIITSNDPDTQSKDETNLRNTFLAMGLVKHLVRFASKTYPSQIRMCASALLRVICFKDCHAFCRTGGLLGLVPLLDVNLNRSDVRYAITSLECISHLIHTTALYPIICGDICHKMAIFLDIVPILTDFLIKVDAWVKELTPASTRRDRVAGRKLKYGSLHRGKLKRMNSKKIKAVRRTELTGNSLPRVGESGGQKVTALRLTTTQDGPRDALDKACIANRDKRNSVTKGTVKREGLQLRIDVMMKIAKILNTLATPRNLVTDYVVQSMFLTEARLLECTMEIAMDCKDNNVISTLVNTLALLVSSPKILEKLFQVLMTHNNQPIKSSLMECMISLLRKFSNLQFTNKGHKWDWTLADILHSISALCKDSFRGFAGKGNLQNAVDLGLVEHLFCLLQIRHQNQSEDSPKKNLSTINARTVSNSVRILGADRKQNVNLLEYMFPLIFRIGTSPNKFLRSVLQKQSPSSLLPLLLSSEYRTDVFSILNQWMLDDRVAIGTFMMQDRTRTEILKILGDESTVPPEYLRIMKILEGMFRLSVPTSQVYAFCKSFVGELRKSVLEKHRDRNNIKIIILKILHLFLSQGQNTNFLITHMQLDEVLAILMEDKSAVLVRRFATALHHQFIEREEVEKEEKQGRKYKKKTTKNCMLCQKRFTIFDKKHYCKQCHIVICSECSPEKCIILSIDREKALRVCDNCAEILKSGNDKPTTGKGITKSTSYDGIPKSKRSIHRVTRRNSCHSMAMPKSSKSPSGKGRGPHF